MTGIPNTNPADIQEFFKKTIPDQIHLTAIDPKKARRAVGKDSGTDAEAASRWALQHNAEGFNVYFTTNRVRPGLGAERNKGDIVGVRFAHVDVDPPKGVASFTPEQREAAYERLKAASPSLINWSGNGLQALWRLEEGVSIDEVEQSVASSRRWGATRAPTTPRACSASRASSTGRMPKSLPLVVCLHWPTSSILTRGSR